MSACIPTAWLRIVVKQITQRPVEDDTAKGETTCVWEGQEISLVWGPDFTFLSTVKLGDIIQARGELLVSVRIKKKRKATLNLRLAVAEVEPAKEAPVAEAETADEEPLVDAESTNEAPVAAAESANKALIVDPESTNKNSHGAEDLGSDHRKLVELTGTGRLRKHSTSSKRARSSSSASSQELVVRASNTDMTRATTGSSSSSSQALAAMASTDFSGVNRDRLEHAFVAGLVLLNGRGRRIIPGGDHLFPWAVDESFLFEQRFEDGRRRVIRVETSIRQQESLDTLRTYETWC